MSASDDCHKPIAIPFYCPHCGTKAQFNLIFPDPNQLRLTKTNDGWAQATFRALPNQKCSFSILQCQVCSKLVFRAIIVDDFSGKSRLIGQFPSDLGLESDFTDCLPNDILVDFESAIKCFEFQEFRASAAMGRRALQASLLEQGAKPDLDLFDQINDMNARMPDRFTNDIKDWAHNIRVFGNWGAHPDKDGLKDVGEDTSKEIIQFLKSYFHYVYKMPQKVADARSKQKPKP